MLRDLKSYAGRVLNNGGKPASGTWWTESGSKQKVRNLLGAVEYVRDQPFALAVYVAESGERGASAP